MEPVVKDPGDGGEQMDTGQDQHADTGSTEGGDFVAAQPQSRNPSVRAQEVDAFDGYSFEGRHPVAIDDDENSDLSYSNGEDGYEEGEGVYASISGSEEKPEAQPVKIPAAEIREQNGSKGGVADRYRLAIFGKSTSSRHGNRTVSGMSKMSGTESVSPSPSGKQSRGRTPSFFWNKKNISKTPQTLSSATNKVAHSGYTDTLGDTRGPRRSKARSRAQWSRSGSVSSGHLSGGRQSPDDDGESKKKVGWYDV